MPNQKITPLIGKAIREGKYLNITYKNRDDEVTRFWIGKAWIIVLLVLIAIKAQGQIIISGKITDKFDDYPIPGVNVIEKGTNNGAVTDTSGYFTLHVSDENSILDIGFVGYKPQEIKVGEVRYFTVKLKQACFIDFFDYRDLCIGLSSGAINNPTGAFGYITFPFAHLSTLYGEIDYQTNLSENAKLNLKAGSLHLFADCGYNGDLFFNYRKMNSQEFDFDNYLVEGKLNLSHPRMFLTYSTIYIGYGFSNLSKPGVNYKNAAGYLFGLGTYIGRPVYMNIGFKTMYWTNYWELKGELKSQFKNLLVSLDYNAIDKYNEINIKLGYIINY